MTNWNPEEGNPEDVVMREGKKVEKVLPKEYKAKVSLALVDSGDETWGVVEDTLGNICWKPGQGEIVGTWSRAPYDNLIHMGLTTSLEALQDRAIQIWKKYADERKMAPVVKARRKAGVPVPDSDLEIQAKFNTLREKLIRARQSS